MKCFISLHTVGWFSSPRLMRSTTVWPADGGRSQWSSVVFLVRADPLRSLPMDIYASSRVNVLFSFIQKNEEYTCVIADFRLAGHHLW